MTPADRRILESAHLPPARRQELSLELGLGITGATQRLLQLLDDPEAEREYPAIVRRQRRLRDQGRATRSARRLAI